MFTRLLYLAETLSRECVFKKVDRFQFIFLESIAEKLLNNRSLPSSQKRYATRPCRYASRCSNQRKTDDPILVASGERDSIASRSKCPPDPEKNDRNR